MNNRTLTSANAVIMLSVSGLFNAPVRIQGFSADDITDMDTVKPTETSMGLDGRLSAGYAPVATPQNITLQADSLSNDFFEQWVTAEKSARTKYVATGLILVPAVEKKVTMTRGFLVSYPPIAALRRSLQPRRYSLEWEDVTPAPYGG